MIDRLDRLFNDSLFCSANTELVSDYNINKTEYKLYYI